MKSNLGIYEEFSKFSAYLNPAEGHSCPNPDCDNYNKTIENKKVLYKSKGRTPSRKSQRYMCKACGKTFSIPISTIARQRLSHRTKYMFKALCNKNPFSGVQTRDEYTMYGHFFHLRKLLNNARRVCFFLDQESGIRAACFAAFWKKIISRSCDAFYVKIDREWGQDYREYFQFRGKWLIQDYLSKHPELTRSQARKEIIKIRMKEMKVMGQYGDKWLMHPFPTLAEPEKQVCHLTNFNDYSEDHQAWLYNKSSMHAINVFFANIRRKLSMLERPIATPSSLNAKWYGYSPSNPAMVNKLLTIHRVWYNYAKRRRNMKITPAMKLGLAKAPIDINDILYGKMVSERKFKTFVASSNKQTDFFRGPEPIPSHPLKGQKVNLYKGPELPKVVGRHALRKMGAVFIDTETTGIGLDDDIVEIAIVDKNGKTLLNSLVKPNCPISSAAFAKHGISEEMVQDAPTLRDIEEKIIDAVEGRHVVIYNAPFDTRYFTQPILDAMATPSCSMRRFARYYGIKNKEPEPHQWLRLKAACQEIGFTWPGKAHRALADALACRAVWLFLEDENADYV